MELASTLSRVQVQLLLILVFVLASHLYFFPLACENFLVAPRKLSVGYFSSTNIYTEESFNHLVSSTVGTTEHRFMMFGYLLS
jgi:hypothetical protein